MRFLQVVLALLAVSAFRLRNNNADAFAPSRSGTSERAVRKSVSPVVLSQSNIINNNEEEAATTSATTTTEAQPPRSSLARLVENLPDLETLKTAPFMKQVQYGTDLTETLDALTKENDEHEYEGILGKVLAAQLSHSDGIRGFMVAYLTGSYESSTNEDGSISASEMVANEKDPSVLLEAILGLLAKEASDHDKADELVPLMCMNVVMPIAMITKHTDPALSEASKLTAARGIRLLGSVMGGSASIKANLEALREVATTATSNQTIEVTTTSDDNNNDDDDDDLVAYWTKFFGKWGYEDPQKKDIAATMEELLSKAPQ